MGSGKESLDPALARTQCRSTAPASHPSGLRLIFSNGKRPDLIAGPVVVHGPFPGIYAASQRRPGPQAVIQGSNRDPAVRQLVPRQCHSMMQCIECRLGVSLPDEFSPVGTQAFALCPPIWLYSPHAVPRICGPRTKLPASIPPHAIEALYPAKSWRPLPVAQEAACMDVPTSSVTGFNRAPVHTSTAAHAAGLGGKNRLARRIRNPAFHDRQVAARAQHCRTGIDMRSDAGL